MYLSNNWLLGGTKKTMFSFQSWWGSALISYLFVELVQEMSEKGEGWSRLRHRPREGKGYREHGPSGLFFFLSLRFVSGVRRANSELISCMHGGRVAEIDITRSWRWHDWRETGLVKKKKKASNLRFTHSKTAESAFFIFNLAFGNLTNHTCAFTVSDTRDHLTSSCNNALY